MTLTVGQNEEHLSKSFISTGQLPASTIIQDLVDDAYARYCSVEDGKNASYYPALADVPRDLFGICITHVNGREFTAGDVAVTVVDDHKVVAVAVHLREGKSFSRQVHLFTPLSEHFSSRYFT